jgi:outer membrane receptor for ferrienterochelin and colicin
MPLLTKEGLGEVRNYIMVKNYLFVCIVFLSIQIQANNQVQYGNLEGRVLEANNQQPIAGANVEIIGIATGACSNQTGYFLITNIPIGVYQVQVSMMGYQSQIKTEISIVTKRTTAVTFALQPAILQLDSCIEVTADYFYQNRDKPISIKSLNPQEIRFSAGSAEDIFRIIQAMPGVMTNGSLSANLIVRGGSPDENRTLLDNIEIYSPLHFARPGTSMGIISIINPALISNIAFSSGGFPAVYGDKLSSVFEINLKEGNYNRFNSELTLNLGGVGSYLEGPLSDNTQMVFSARRGYFDILTNMMNSPVSPQYWDFVMKVSHNPNPSHRFSLIGFYYQDDFEKKGLSENLHHPDGENYFRIKGQVKGGAAGLNWTYLINEKAYLQTTLSYNCNSWQSQRGSQVDPNQDGDEIAENEFHLKSHIHWQLSAKLELQSGLLWKQIDTNHHLWYNADTTKTGIFLPSTTISFNPDWTYKTGIFIQSTWHPLRPLIVTAGIRSDYYQFTTEQKVSPRFGIKYFLSDKVTVNGAYGYYYQTPNAFSVALHPANQELRSGRSIHTIAGIEYLPLSDTKLSLEFYQKDLYDLPVEHDYNRIITNEGNGYSRGLEFCLQRKMSSNFVGSLAYTYAHARRKEGLSAPEHDFEFDQRHNVTFIAGYQLSNEWRLGLKYQYATGLPYTPIIGTTNRSGNWYVLEGAPYSARYPDLQKLDLRIDRFFHFTNWTMGLYLDLWNAFDHKNVLIYSYSCDDQGALTQKANYDFPMMPILGISAQF